ncbi:sulfotransferase 1B1 [Condylostylus longicornis]|uniref:sulfotransferase 1B1 n=1 Tax=Condylostylus longicornis TaxID=2530218 RepID=UPI00244DD368|nr:sulfotransferase 1B1 [Condylostylus longicornis]
MSFNNNKGEIPFPYEITPLDPETNTDLLKYFHGERTGFVQVGPEKYFFPWKYKNSAEHFYNFQARPDDIWIATFPRSGTTWTQELIWLIANNLDFKTAKTEYLTKRFPFFEFSNFMHDEVKKELLEDNSDNPEKQQFIEAISEPGYELFAKMTERRFIKTHFPFSLLPPSVMEQQCKVIYIARNPKDVAVSFYHLNRLYRTQGYIGDFEKYWDCFEKGLNPWMPYWSHIKEGWKHRHHSNVLFMFYEDMVKNFPDAIRRVGKFLEKPLNDDQVEQLRNYLDIKNFKNNEAVNGKELREVKVLNDGEAGFVRNGKSDGWQTEYTPELRQRAEEWINKNLKELDIKFPETLV